jgi:hypothetical protein
MGLKSLSVQLLKELCDPQGFNANKKYAGGEVINPHTVIVTSNFTIGQCFLPGTHGIEQQKSALHRRFRQVHINDFLTERGLVLCSPSEVAFAKISGIWDKYGYKCMFKPKDLENLTDYSWLTPLEEEDQITEEI